MLLPSKITNYNKSGSSKCVPVLKELTKKDKRPLALYKSTKSHFSSVNEFVETLDCLYDLGKIDIDEEYGVIHYAKRNI